MPIELLFAAIALTSIASKAFSKLCSNHVSQNSVSDFSIVLIINCTVACLFFFFSSGFALSLNQSTFLYSVAYAIIVAISLISNILIYKFTSVSNVSVISSTCGVIATVCVGGLLFHEDVEANTLIRLAIMMLAMGFVFADRRKPRPDQKNAFLPLILLIAVNTFCSCANTVILKAFSMSTSVTDEHSFFFFTNVVLCIGASCVLGYAIVFHLQDVRRSLQLLKPGKLVSVAGNTVCSNISSILTVWIIALMDVSLFSPLSSALGILTGVIASLIFREKQGIFAYIAAAVACMAIMI